MVFLLTRIGVPFWRKKNYGHVRYDGKTVEIIDVHDSVTMAQCPIDLHRRIFIRTLWMERLRLTRIGDVLDTKRIRFDWLGLICGLWAPTPKCDSQSQAPPKLTENKNERKTELESIKLTFPTVYSVTYSVQHTHDGHWFIDAAIRTENVDVYVPIRSVRKAVPIQLLDCF